MNVLQKIGGSIFDVIQGSGYATVLLIQALTWLHTLPGRVKEVLRQMHTDGIQNLHVVATVATFTGMVLALQAGIELGKYGQQAQVGLLVAASMCREMGPFMTGLILAACAGSAMAAEIGTMKVSEEIDALEIMSIDPVKFLVIPRIVSMTLICPLLTIYTDIIGIVGGGLVARTQMGVSFTVYFDNAIRILSMKDIYSGLFKAMVFGVIIATVSCSQGLRAKNGALGVGHATRISVVNAFLLILITGYFLTSLFYR